MWASAICNGPMPDAAGMLCGAHFNHAIGLQMSKRSTQGLLSAASECMHACVYAYAGG